MRAGRHRVERVIRATQYMVHRDGQVGKWPFVGNQSAGGSKTKSTRAEFTNLT